MKSSIRSWRAIGTLTCCGLLSCSDEPGETLLVDAGAAIASRSDASAARDSAPPTVQTRPDAAIDDEQEEEDNDDDEGDLDSGAEPSPRDAGRRDAGTKRPDAGAVKRDAGAGPDAGNQDAGSLDAGSQPDSAIVDSSTPTVDSSTPVVDSGGPVPDSGAAMTDAGGMASDGGSSSPDAGYVRSAVCQACLDINCSNYLGVVPTLSDCSDALCNQIVACAEQSRCVQGPLSVTNCYCGDVDFDECAAAAYVPNGVCKTLIEQGLDSTVKDTVLERYLDNVNYAGGKANYLLTCEADLCVPECLL